MVRSIGYMILGCCTAVGGLLLWNHGPQVISQAVAQTTASGIASGSISDLTALSDRFEAVAKRVLPAVVSIEASKVSGTSGNQKRVEDSGSGVMIAAENNRGVLVVTNNHVIDKA